MKEHFKIMLKQKNHFHLHLITAKAHVLSLKVRSAERQSKKNPPIYVFINIRVLQTLLKIIPHPAYDVTLLF